jgi:two-component system, LytTR family, response regulator
MTNPPIRVVIADDEPIARRGIRQLLSAYDDIEIAAEARNGKEAVRLLRLLLPDLVFLDVQMPEFDGFEALRRLDQSSLPAVIFVTAYDTFAVRAFETRAVDYLVKPVNETRFREALARVRERLRSLQALELSRRLSMRNGAAESNRLGPLAAPRRLVIAATNGSDLILDVAEITWIEAYDYYAAVHTAGGRHLVRESLASLEKRLDRSQFVRVHRSAIVNLAHVRTVQANLSTEPAFVLHDGTQLRLSRRRRRTVQLALRRFVG